MRGNVKRDLFIQRNKFCPKSQNSFTVINKNMDGHVFKSVDKQQRGAPPKWERPAL